MNPSNIYNKDFDLRSLINVLDSVSYESKLGKNLKNTLRKFDKEELFRELKDCRVYYKRNLLLIPYRHRVKSSNSIKMKYDKYYPSKEIKSCFNDILGIRILVDSLDLLFLQLDSYIKINDLDKLIHIADLRLGKRVDDGYKAIHLYYQKSNIHYPIEVQFWYKGDYNFHNWTHKYSYKYKNSRYGKIMRDLFSRGAIKSEDDFVKYLSAIEESM